MIQRVGPTYGPIGGKFPDQAISTALTSCIMLCYAEDWNNCEIHSLFC